MASRSPMLRIMFVLMASLLASLAAVAQDDDPPPADAGEVLATASYPLFPVEASGIDAQVQVSERAEGGSQLTVSVSGIDEGATYRAALYEGDCGPDRPIVLELAPFGLGNDPYVSITDSDLSFDAISSGDHFVYLFQGDEIDRPETFGLDGNVLSCGEVGAGAIR